MIHKKTFPEAVASGIKAIILTANKTDSFYLYDKLFALQGE